LKYMAFCGN